MKKISQSQWGYYKESNRGKGVIRQFNKFLLDDCPVEDMVTISAQFNPIFFANHSTKELEFVRNWFQNCIENVKGILFDYGGVQKVQDLEDFYKFLTYILAVPEEDVAFDDAPQIGFKQILSSNLPISIALFRTLPKFFIPNLFVCQFIYFKKLFDKYNIELPTVPNRSDYRGRWLYYLEICKAINAFAEENGLLDRAELCAFFFDYELTAIKELSDEEHEQVLSDIPDNAWILVGNRSEGEKDMEAGIWQANPFTRKGDVLLFYEKSPVKKMNAVWRALEDGVIDPFFHYYSYTLIGQRIQIPTDQAITFEEFKNSDYFKVENRGHEGNFVRKNFQDVSGWAVYYKDYAEIKRMLVSKGFDVNVLPSLDEPMEFSAKEIRNEEDVYNKLITPLLEQMGWKKGLDYEREVEFAAGHTTTHHPSNKRPDYCLHITRQDGKVKESKVVIEAKELFKGTADVDECFDQCESYARWGKAKVLLICDKIHIFVYEQDRNGSFYKDKHKTTFTWVKLKEDEEFKKLKRKLDIKQ